MAFYQPGTLPGGSIVSFDSTGNLDPVTPVGPATKDHQGSTGDATAGSDTITNVTQIQTWCVGDPIGDSVNAIVGPTPASASIMAYVTAVDYVNRTLTVSKNAVLTSVGATFFYPFAFISDDVLAGQIINIILNAAGTGFTLHDILTITAPSLGPIAGNALNSGGGGYAFGDTFTVDNPTPGAVLATGTIDGVDMSGAVQFYHLTSYGTLYATGSANATTATSGGGTGFTINISSIISGGAGVNGQIEVDSLGAMGAIASWHLLPGSYNWITGAAFAVTGGSGSGATFDITQVADATYTSGNISAGLHGVAISFRTRSGYYTEPTQLMFWQCAGNRSVVVNYVNANVNLVHADNPVYTSMAFFFTQANDLNLYQIPSSIVGIGSTVLTTFNFFDTDLANGDNVNNFYDNLRISDQAGLTQYNSRLVTWGGLNTVKLAGMDLLGLIVTNSNAQKFPYGWAPGTANNGALQSINAPVANTPGLRPATFIQGDGSSVVTGEIWQSEAAEQLEPLTSYTIRIWLKKSAGLVAGSVTINLIGTGIGIGGSGLTVGFTVPAASLSTSWAQFTGQICTATDVPVSTGINQVTADLRLRIVLGGTATNLEGAHLSRAQLYPTSIPYESSVLRFSDPFNADRFDAISGFQLVSADDSERIVSCEQLRWYFYAYKDRSMHVTFDDGQNPPSLWTTNLVDSVCGTGSPNSTVATESFSISAARPGAYIFFGGKPLKISQEIQTTWDRINWSACSTIHAILDPKHHIVYFFVPLDSNGVPSAAIILDYTEGFGQEDEPGGRKWGVDLYPAQLYASLVGESPTHQQVVWFAGKPQDGFIVPFPPATVFALGKIGDTDGPLAVDSYYETSYARAQPNGTSLFGGVAFTVSGSGVLALSMLPLGAQAGDDREVTLLPVSMSTPLTRDLERYANFESERGRVRFETNAVNVDDPTKCDYFEVRRVGIYAAAWAAQRVY